MYIIGLELKKASFSLTLLHKEKGKVAIKTLQAFSLEADLKKEIDQLFKGPNKPFYEVATSISASSSFVRLFFIELMKKSAVKQALPFQIESILPYPKEEAKLCFHIDSQEKGSLISLLSAKTVDVKNYIDNFLNYHIDPDWVGAVPYSLLAFVKHFCTNWENTLIFHIGEKESCVVLLQQGNIKQSVSVPISVNDLDDENAQKQLIRVAEFCLMQSKTTNKYIVLGEVNKLDFCEQIFPPHIEKLGLNVNSSHEFKDLCLHAVSIGSALNAVDIKPIQLRTKEIISPQHKNRAKRLTQVFCLGAISSCFIFYAFTSLMLHMQSRQIKEQYNHIVETTKTPSIKRIDTISTKYEDLEQFLDKTEELKDLFDRKNPAVNFHKTPKLVSEFIYWLNVHPKLQNAEIKQLKYEMESWPNLEKPFAPLLTKGTLIFAKESASKALEFYHYLKRKGDNFIDAKKDIIINKEQEEYCISFFFKNS